MKRNGRGNALLTELLIVLLFFMLAATTLVELFAAARQNSQRASATTAATIQMQNMAEALYAADDMQQTLTELGFVQVGSEWQKDCESYRLKAVCRQEAIESGQIHRTELTAEWNGEALLSLPATRYIPGEVQP